MSEFDILINSLCVIASPYAIQKSYYPQYVSLGDELANELECLDFIKDKLIDEKKLSLDLLNEILEIDKQFYSISLGECKYSPELWEELSIEKDNFWEEQRNRAKKILKKLGVEYHLPTKK